MSRPRARFIVEVGAEDFVRFTSLAHAEIFVRALSERTKEPPLTITRLAYPPEPNYHAAAWQDMLRASDLKLDRCLGSAGWGGSKQSQ